MKGERTFRKERVVGFLEEFYATLLEKQNDVQSKKKTQKDISNLIDGYRGLLPEMIPLMDI